LETNCEYAVIDPTSGQLFFSRLFPYILAIWPRSKQSREKPGFCRVTCVKMGLAMQADLFGTLTTDRDILRCVRLIAIQIMRTEIRR
jgi:hypothetical protein